MQHSFGTGQSGNLEEAGKMARKTVTWVHVVKKYLVRLQPMLVWEGENVPMNLWNLAGQFPGRRLST